MSKNISIFVSKLTKRAAGIFVESAHRILFIKYINLETNYA